MTAAVNALGRVGIRPRLRRRELGLLVLVMVALTVGWASYVSFRDGHLELADTSALATYFVALLAIHALFVLSGRRMDEILFPTAALLAGVYKPEPGSTVIAVVSGGNVAPRTASGILDPDEG